MLLEFKIKYLYSFVTIILFSWPFLLPASEIKEIDYEFIQKKNYYSFKGTFLVKAKPDCLLNLIYNFEHLSNYAMGAKLIELLRKGNNWYEVRYVYRKFLIFKHQSTWRRTLKPIKHKIVFEMISNKNNINILPRMVSSTGYYQIKTEKEGCVVVYFQECNLKSGLFKKSYINIAKKEALNFLQVLKEFLNKSCGSSNN